MKFYSATGYRQGTIIQIKNQPYIVVTCIFTKGAPKPYQVYVKPILVLPTKQ